MNETSKLENASFMKQKMQNIWC